MPASQLSQSTSKEFGVFKKRLVNGTFSFRVVPIDDIIFDGDEETVGSAIEINAKNGPFSAFFCGRGTREEMDKLKLQLMRENTPQNHKTRNSGKQSETKTPSPTLKSQAETSSPAPKSLSNTPLQASKKSTQITPENRKKQPEKEASSSKILTSNEKIPGQLLSDDPDESTSLELDEEVTNCDDDSEKSFVAPFPKKKRKQDDNDEEDKDPGSVKEINQSILLFLKKIDRKLNQIIGEEKASTSDENDGVTPKKVVKRRRSLKEDEDGAVDWSMEEYMNQQAFIKDNVNLVYPEKAKGVRFPKFALIVAEAVFTEAEFYYGSLKANTKTRHQLKPQRIKYFKACILKRLTAEVNSFAKAYSEFSKSWPSIRESVCQKMLDYPRRVRQNDLEIPDFSKKTMQPCQNLSCFICDRE